MINYVSEACGYLLPCEMCRITMKQCPHFPCKIEPTWTNTTAGMGTVTVNAKGEVQTNATN